MRICIATDKQKREFRGACCDFLQAMVKKMKEKSPATYPLVRMMTSLDPHRISKEDKKKDNVKKFTGCLSIMSGSNWIREDEVDCIVSQYKHFLDAVMEEHQESFKNFKPEEERLDQVLSYHLQGVKEYRELWHVVRQLLLLSHGQATVERGFSVNKEASSDNISQLSLVARCQIINHVRKVGGVKNVPITHGLIMSASSARKKYFQHLEQLKTRLQRKEQEQAEVNRKRKAQEEKLSELKEKKRRIEKDIDHLIVEADRLAEQAEMKGALRLLTQSNALRSKSKEKKTELSWVTQELDEAQTKFCS